MSHEFEVIDQIEGIMIKTQKKVTHPPDPKYEAVAQAIAGGGVIFLPGITVNKLSQYRYHVKVKFDRSLASRSGERDGVKGVYLWLGPPIK